ncbi:hypothetical protein PMAC_002140 [Pneumocystis sp. 'macacae']|nr:hypothetical protein PMAC_002140 [Pneumocystis sp. 'macacae']
MFAWDLRQFRLNLAVLRLRWIGGVGRKKGTGIEWQSLHRSWNTQSWKVMELGNRVKNKTKEVEADVKFSLELRKWWVKGENTKSQEIDSYLKSKEESFFEQIKSTRELMRWSEQEQGGKEYEVMRHRGRVGAQRRWAQVGEVGCEKNVYGADESVHEAASSR